MEEENLIVAVDQSYPVITSFEAKCNRMKRFILCKKRKSCCGVAGEQLSELLLAQIDKAVAKWNRIKRCFLLKKQRFKSKREFAALSSIVNLIRESQRLKRGCYSLRDEKVFGQFTSAEKRMVVSDKREQENNEWSSLYASKHNDFLAVSVGSVDGGVVNVSIKSRYSREFGHFGVGQSGVSGERLNCFSKRFKAVESSENWSTPFPQLITGLFHDNLYLGIDL